MKMSKITKTALIVSSLFSINAMADVKIALIAPFTGGSRDFGIAQVEGAKLAAAEINAKGGINGEKISLVEYDDQSKPDVGESLAKQAIEKDKVVAIMGTTNTAITNKIAAVAQQAKIPYIITASTGGAAPATFTKEPVNYTFRLTPYDGIQAKMLAAHLVDEMKYKNIIIIADDTPYGQTGLDRIVPELEKKKVTPVKTIRFKPGTYDVEEQALQARAANADAVIIWSLGSDAAIWRLTFNRIGWRVPMAGPWPMTQKIYNDNAGEISNESSRMVILHAEDSDRPQSKQFFQNYKIFNNRSTQLSAMASPQGYDAMYLYSMAATQAKSVNGEKVVRAMENLEGTYAGVIQDYNKPWTKDQHEGFNDPNVLRIGQWKNNKIKVFSKPVVR